MSIELVVFDMAGTTVNDEDSVSRCVRAALEAVGVTVSVADVNEVMGIPKPEAIRHLVGKSPLRDELADRIGEIHRDFVARSIRFYESDPSVREVPGAEQTFRIASGGGDQGGAQHRVRPVDHADDPRPSRLVELSAHRRHDLQR